MFRKIIVLLLSVFIGIQITGYSQKINIEGIKWFVPERGGCGNHWGGLPFAYSYIYINTQDKSDTYVLECVGVSKLAPMVIDLVLWIFAVYALTGYSLSKLRNRKTR